MKVVPGIIKIFIESPRRTCLGILLLISVYDSSSDAETACRGPIADRLDAPGRMGEQSIGQTNSLIGGIKDDIEALKESVTVDKIEFLTRRGEEIIYDEIYAASSPTNPSVEGPGPELSVGGQFKSRACLEERLRLPHASESFRGSKETLAR